jgi:tetratricopeptide (TPR) repeat protein
VTRAEVLAQLDRILRHQLFANSPRLSAFLKYAVEAALSGELDRLKEIVIGAEVLGRGEAFDPQTDNSVRVTAIRLRGKLAEYYHHSGQSDPVIIDLPRGRYVPSFSMARFTAPVAAQAAAAASVRASVGREKERDQIRAAFLSASSGAGTMVMIAGNAGMGKTTIVEDSLAEIQADPAAAWIVRGRCSERLSNTDAFVPAFDCLEDLVRADPEGQAARLLEETAPTWSAQIKGRGADAAFVAREVSRERMRREFARLFETLSSIRPVVLFLDDLHWADASTCDLLAYLGSRMKDRRILILATYRPSGLPTAHPFLPVRLSLERTGVCHEIPLDFLTAKDIEQYLNIRFPGHTFPCQLVEVVRERTEGSPLFLSDMIGFLLNGGVLANEAGRWRLTREVAEIRKVIPTTSHSMIRLQIDQFSALDRKILHCAAVQGVEFDSEVVSRALALESVEVEEQLQSLERVHHFVRFIGERTCLDRAVSIRYRFAHVYYQNALYADLMPARRTALSLAVAHALVALNGDTSRSMAAEVAFLFECGRDDGRASEFYLRAARYAASLFAYPEAIVLCERGLAGLRLLPESRERDARELRFTQILGLAQMATCGFAAPEVEKTHRRSRELCLRLNEKGRLVKALWGIHTCVINAGELARALELAQEMRRVADESKDPVSIVESLHALGTTCAFMGNLADARQALESILTVLPSADHKFSPSVYVLDTYVTTLSMLARVLARLGLAQESLERARSSLSFANELAHPPSVAYATFWVGWIRHACGEFALACSPLEAAMLLGRKHGLPQIVEWGRVVHGSSLAHLGRVADGISEMRTSLDNQLAMHSLLERPYCLTLLAEALVWASRAKEALMICDEALQIAEQTHARSYEEETHRIRRNALTLLESESSGDPIA